MPESVYDSFSRDTIAAAESLSAMMDKERTTYRRLGYLHELAREDFILTELDRTKLVDWCYCIIDHMELNREIVWIAMEMVDRFLSLGGDHARAAHGDHLEFQLLVIAALYTSIKANSPVVIDSSCITAMTNGCYTREEIEAMERSVLEGLSWHVCAPTSVQMAHHILSLVYHRVALTESAWALILDEIRFQTECAVRDYQLSIQRASSVAVAAILNSLAKIDSADQRAVLQALLPVMNKNFDSPRSILATRSRLLALVEESDDLVAETTTEAMDWSSTGACCQEIDSHTMPRVRSICDVSDNGVVDSSMNYWS